MSISPIQATVTVASAGTAVQANSSSIGVVSLYVEALKTNSGVIYVGTSGCSSTAYIAALAAGAGFSLGSDAQGRLGGELKLSSIWLNTSSSGDAAQVTYLQRMG